MLKMIKYKTDINTSLVLSAGDVDTFHQILKTLCCVFRSPEEKATDGFQSLIKQTVVICSFRGGGGGGVSNTMHAGTLTQCLTALLS